jgi:SAM-dependent methyltransferase
MICSTFTGEIPGLPAGNDSCADALLSMFERFSGIPRTIAGNCIRVLDVGTGTARIPIDVCSRRRDIRLTAVDRATRALQTANRTIAKAGLSHAIQVVRADAHSLPFANASFEAVISNGLLHHVANQLGVLDEMTRVLRPGGLLFIRDALPGSDAGRIAQVLSGSCKSPDTRREVFKNASNAMLTIDEARDLAAAAGFPRECVRQSDLRHWVLAGVLALTCAG